MQTDAETTARHYAPVCLQRERKRDGGKEGRRKGERKGYKYKAQNDMSPSNPSPLLPGNLTEVERESVRARVVGEHQENKHPHCWSSFDGMVFVLAYILFSHVWLLSLRCLFFSNERRKGNRSREEGCEEELINKGRANSKRDILYQKSI